MAENSKISWTDATFNCWRGCTKVSPGCKFCYAEKMSGRNPAVLGEWGPNGTRVVAADAQWREPVKWNREAAAEGVRKRVFCASLADVFEGPDTMPGQVGTDRETNYLPTLFNDEITAARQRLFHLIDNTPSLDWLLLTKRPRNVMPLYGNYLHWTRTMSNSPVKFPHNVWIGTSVENQECAETRISILLTIPARIRFVSAEPLLDAIDLRPWLDKTNGVQWVIVGGESGGEARPFNSDWARVVRDQCGDAGVPFFMKQTGSAPIQLTVRKKGDQLDDLPPDLRVREFPTAS